MTTNKHLPQVLSTLSFGGALPEGISIQDRLCQQGFGVLSAEALYELVGPSADTCPSAFPSWANLPADIYLKDGGNYRYRRHSSFIQHVSDREPVDVLDLVPHRPHWQPTSYNALHGGMSRQFEPLPPQLLAMPFWQPLVTRLGRLFAQIRPVTRWFIEAHQFRIDTGEGLGRPTPEGAHRDGVDFVAVILIDRHHIRGGETRVFELDGVRGVRFTLSEPCSVLLMDDTRVIHESTPIVPDDDSHDGWRDTLVLTYRSGGFLAP